VSLVQSDIVLAQDDNATQAKAKTEYQALLKKYEANRQDRQFVRPFLELAEAYSGTASALDSLTWVLKRFESGSHADRAITLLIASHAGNPGIEQLYLHVGNNPSLKVDTFYRKVIAINKTASAVGRAHFRLGNYLVRQSEIAREIRANPQSVDKFNLFYGADLTEYLQKVDLKKIREDALEQFTVAVRKYGSVRNYKGELSELAGREKFKIEHLSVGGTAPEIVGEDIAGKPMKLSDYRGKVVLLDFWGDWCVACRMLLPFNRALVKQFDDRPFELLGVNSDSDRNYARKVVQTQQISWRSFWNGGSRFGDISSEWAVEKWPVLYVIDAKGVVRMRSAGGHNKEEIYELIKKLVEEAESQ
jgi:thiol-disulfide isomerase/thioredoxin|tara:strand:- start:4012 stop:5094 length:1083 start_codon:yes stop_codon:yes gene_type:complete